MPFGVIVRDDLGSIVYANTAAHQLLRCPVGTLVGEGFPPIPGLSIEDSDCRIAKVTLDAGSTGLAANHVCHIRQRLCFRDGEDRWVDAMSLPLRGPDGGNYVITSIHQVTGPTSPADFRNWLENHVLQTVVGITLTLESVGHHRAASEEIQWLLAGLRGLVREIRHLTMRDNSTSN